MYGRAALRLDEIFGLRPLGTSLRQAALTVRGDRHTPRTRFDHTSLRILKPRLSAPLWLGRPARGRLVPIYNLVNRDRPPPVGGQGGWSVRVTRVRDFRGRGLTYDSHNGTDLAVPPGTVVVAAAPGRVLRVSSEFDRGGLKIFLDHGAGLATTYNHLARSLVRVGDQVRRAQPIALSGMSGIDGVIAFPLSTPHVHFNVWLDGEYVDPFAAPGETSLWRAPNRPVPHHPAPSDALEEVPPARWDHDAVAATIASCRHAKVREELGRIEDPALRAMSTLFQRNYYPTRFAERPSLYRSRTAPRDAARLDLPLEASHWDGVWFPDEPGAGHEH